MSLNSDKKDKSTVDVAAVETEEGARHFDDIAAKYADGVEGGYSAAEEKKLVRKVDFILMGFLWFNVTWAALDKVSVSTASIYGIIDDLNLVGNRYSLILSSFYYGYLFWCFPSAIFLQKLPVAKLAGACFFVWGVLLIGLGFAQNFGTMIALRILIGMAEAPIVSINLIIVSMWYVKGPEQSVRIGLFYTGLSTLFTGIIGYCVGGYTNTPYLPWRYFFWIIGAVSCVYGVFMFLILPDSPVSSRFFNNREKSIIIDRVRKNKTGVKNPKFKWPQVWECMKDPKTWLMFWIQICISIPNSFTVFSHLIVEGLGWSPRDTCLLNIPNGLFQTLSVYLSSGMVALLEHWYPQKHFRGAVLCICILPALIGTGCLYKLPLDAYIGRLISLYFGFFYLGSYILTLNLVTANTAGFTKKITTNSLMFFGYAVSNIVGPNFFLSSQAPTYGLGVGAIFFAYAVTIVSILVYMFLCYRENVSRDKKYGPAVVSNEESDLLDLTDKENKHFRYKW